MKNWHVITITSTLLLSLWWTGCMPASRISHTQNRAKNDARVLQEARSAPELSTSRRKVLMVAEEWLGTPYVYGGTSRSGADCSGFVLNVFREINVPLPRTSQEQSHEGIKVGLENLNPGDLVFFNTTGGGVSHVGIAIGENKFIHASTSRGVIVSSLDEEYYHERFLFARRVL